MTYAIIAVGGKQYRVREGERLLVDRLPTDEGKTFTPTVLMTGGNGDLDLDGKTPVTARVLGHVRGEKIRIGKYKKRTGYKRHNGYRSALTQIEIESIGAAKRPVRERGPGEGARGSREVPPATSATPAPVRHAHPPKDYDELTVAQISEQASSWRRPNLEAALEHEKENANRKGAIAALEAALKEKGH